ncbi:MAG: hypothetical protein H6993_04525 [Pseudomonadales bacterium]|nr:hypothetical protein [Pseudomonadales bacterium]
MKWQQQQRSGVVTALLPDKWLYFFSLAFLIDRQPINYLAIKTRAPGALVIPDVLYLYKDPAMELQVFPVDVVVGLGRIA